MSDDLILITKDHRGVTADFLIAPYPVSISDYRDLVDGEAAEPAEADYVKQATWDQAIRYCNLLSRRLDLPPSYDEVLGLLIDEQGRPAHRPEDAAGIRLPSAVEWQYAAEGAGAGQDAAWQHIHEHHYWEYDANRWRRRGNLVANTLGLYGLVGNVHEWCSDTDLSHGVKGKRCGWEDYYRSYDTVGYRVAISLQDAGTYGAVRVVRTPR